MIECIWAYLKKETAKNGPPRTKKEAVERWEKAWAAIKQSLLRKRIRRIYRHIIEIIRHEGGNEYLEGTM
jgi:hypothetical protein